MKRTNGGVESRRAHGHFHPLPRLITPRSQSVYLLNIRFDRNRHRPTDDNKDRTNMEKMLTVASFLSLSLPLSIIGSPCLLWSFKAPAADQYLWVMSNVQSKQIFLFPFLLVFFMMASLFLDGKVISFLTTNFQMVVF